MKVRRKPKQTKKTEPKEPVAGLPVGKIGPYERKKTLSAVGYSALGMAIMGIKLIAGFANTQNVSDMLTNGTYTGGIGLVIIGFAVILKNRFTNNTNKKA